MTIQHLPPAAPSAAVLVLIVVGHSGRAPSQAASTQAPDIITNPTDVPVEVS